MKYFDRHQRSYVIADVIVSGSGASLPTGGSEKTFNPNNENLIEEYGLGSHVNLIDLRAATGDEKETILENLSRRLDKEDLDFDKLQTQYGYTDTQVSELKNALGVEETVTVPSGDTFSTTEADLQLQEGIAININDEWISAFLHTEGGSVINAEQVQSFAALNAEFERYTGQEIDGDGNLTITTDSGDIKLTEENYGI